VPLILANFPSAIKDSYGCAKQYNEVSQYFNQKLKEALSQLRKDLPLAAITYVDIYSPKYSLFQNPKKYGKSNQIDPIFKLGYIWIAVHLQNYSDTAILLKFHILFFVKITSIQTKENNVFMLLILNLH